VWCIFRSVGEDIFESNLPRLRILIVQELKELGWLLAGREEKRRKHHLSQVRVRVGHDVQQGGTMLTKQRCQTQTVTGPRSRSAAMTYNLTRETQSILDEHQNSPPSFSVQLYHDNWTLNSGPKFLYNSPAYTVRRHLLLAISHHSLVMFRLCLTTLRQIEYP